MSVRAGLVVAAAVGIAVATALALRSGLPDILEALARLGWQGLLLVCAVNAVAILVRSAGWQVLVRSVGLAGFVAARLVRDGTLVLVWMVPGLGILAGIRTLRQFGTPTATAAACAFLDIVIESASLVLFAIFGLLVILLRVGDDHLWLWLSALGLAAGQLSLIVLLPRHAGAMRFVGKHLRRAARRFGRSAATGSDEILTALASLYGQRRRMALSILSHVVGWALCAAQIWIAARAMGTNLSMTEALAIYGVVVTVTGILVVVPWGIGVQEAAFVLVGAQFGADEATALALSLSIRARDLVFGVPGVMLWLALEGRQTLTRRHMNAGPTPGQA